MLVICLPLVDIPRSIQFLLSSFLSVLCIIQLKRGVAISESQRTGCAHFKTIVPFLNISLMPSPLKHTNGRAANSTCLKENVRKSYLGIFQMPIFIIAQ